MSGTRTNSSVGVVTTSSPTHGCRTLPTSMISAAIRSARLMGIANPRPSEPPESEKIELFTPITRPSAFTRGPPELPGLMAASVWIMSAYRTSWPSDTMSRPIPETTPVVTVGSVFASWYPEGLPIAMAGSPTNRSFESPSGAAGTTPAPIRRTARSVISSEPTSSAACFRPDSSTTSMVVAPRTTWWFVRMCPCSSTTKPDPSPA